MKTVWVFKTSVVEPRAIAKLQPVLDRLINPAGRWNFDLEDCDNILRVESGQIEPLRVIGVLQRKGYRCELL